MLPMYILTIYKTRHHFVGSMSFSPLKTVRYTRGSRAGSAIKRPRSSCAI